MGRAIYIITIFLLLPVPGISQSGFVLTYPCRKGNSEIKKFAPETKDLCLVSSPVVGLDEITSVTELHLGLGRSMIELTLSSEGHKKLRKAMELSPLIVFLYDSEILFVFEPATTELHEVIRIYQVDYPMNFHLWKELVRTKGKDE